MMQKLLVRLQNKKTLGAIFSGVVLILLNSGAIDTGLAHQWDVTFNIVLGILVALGIVSDPEDHVKDVQEKGE